MKKHIKRYTNILFYVLLFAGIAIATYLIVSDARGYEYDLRTGEVNLKGLLLIDSTPSNSQIYVDGERLKVTTADRIELTAESHDIEIQKEGYAPWQKKVRILGERVTNLTYPRLFPEEIINEKLRETSANSLLPSYNHNKAFIYKYDGSFMAIHDLTKEDLPALEEFNFETITGPESKIKNIKWSNDNRFALIRVQNGKDNFQIYLNTENYELINLTKQFSLPFQDLRFDERNNGELLWLNEGELRMVDISGETISTPVVSSVAQYEQNGQFIAYLESGENNNQLSLNITRLGDQTEPNRLDFVDNQPYSFDFIINDDQRTIFLASENNPARIYMTEEGELTRQRTINFNTDSLLSDDLRSNYILARSDNKFLVINPETGQTFQYALPYDSIKSLRWLDGSYLGAIADGKTIIFEFDGKNLREITDSSLTLMRNRDFTVLYTIEGGSLNYSQLILSSDAQSPLPF